jgi:hypothetical protein
MPILYTKDLIMCNQLLWKADGEHEFACVQGQKTLMGRGDIIKETSLEILILKMLMFEWTTNGFIGS